MNTAFVVALLTSLGIQDSAQVQFICNSDQRTASAKMIESIGVGVAYANLVPYYRTTYWVVGCKATRENFRRSLFSAVNSNARTDVFIACHGLDGAFFGMDSIWDSSLRLMRWDCKDLHRLGLVYQTQCYGWSLSDEWILLGADVAVGGLEETLQMQVALEIPLFTKDFGKKRMSVKEARDHSWKLTRWTDRFSSSSSFKHILGDCGYRQR